MFIRTKALLACLLLLAGLATVPAGAQQKYNTRQKQKLNNLRKTYKQKYAAKRAKTYERAKKAHLPVRMVENGKMVELQGFSKSKSGIPLYFSTTNINAAKTISTYKTQLQLGLTGKGITLGVWDGGGVRSTHQEFGSRVLQQDSAASLSSHATHVAGTMVAAGVNFGAKGMSPQANLHAYDWNDDLIEMANEASNGLLLSNHSYGHITGWRYSSSAESWRWYGDTTISATTDYRFGFYNDYSKDLDEIAFNAPYYLICKSAGNERNDNHTGTHQYYNGTAWVTSDAYRKPDGDYDCLGADKVGKNILTIGAVGDISGGYTDSSQVIQTSFSSWGPTDDGRIKPDLVANGLSVFSTDDDHDADYTIKSGTSMATPSVTGSLGLLQQHYQAQNGNYMRSATLKALVIHTANEAGSSEGPDYQNGWGLMNTKAAADVINNRNELALIKEENLTNGEFKIYHLKATGNEPLAVTIVWTDVPGTPAEPALNPDTRMLVNDLDMRIVRWGNTYKPWKLDPANPSAPAFRGDNDRDNVEKIYVGQPTAGIYTVIVKHKKSLSGGNQAFSLVATGITTGSLFCATPINLTSSNITTVSAVLNWEGGRRFSKYDVRYRAQGTTEWTYIRRVRRTSVEVTGLTQGTNYEFQVRSNNRLFPRYGHLSGYWGGHWKGFVSAYAPLEVFTTALPCISAFPYSESFEAGLGSWTQATDDDSDWMRNSGGTPSSGTGPDSASHGEYYVYAEASASNVGYPNKRFVLQSPCFDLGTATQANFSFDYHLYHSDHTGSLTLEASDDNGATWATVWAPADSIQQDNWLSVNVDLAAYTGKGLKLRFIGITSDTYRPDIAIDNIELTTNNNSNSRFNNNDSQAETPDISVAPNPANKYVSVKAFAANSDQVTFTLISASGIAVKTQQIAGRQAEVTAVFDVSRYPKGLYFVKVQTTKGMKVKRVVVY